MLFFWACMLFSVGTGVFAFVAVDWPSAYRVSSNVSSRSVTFAGAGTGDALATVTVLVRTATALKASPTATVVPPFSAGGVTIDGALYRLNAVADPEPAGFFLPAAGQRTVALNVTVTAGDKPLRYRFTQFRLIDTAGREYTWAITNSTPKLESGTLQPGQSKTGWLAFAVPVDVKAVALLVQPGLGGPKIAVSALP